MSDSIFTHPYNENIKEMRSAQISGAWLPRQINSVQ